MGMASMFFIQISDLRRMYSKIESLFAEKRKLPPESERKAMSFPEGGPAVSVETALNSRCTSDYDGDRHRFHWGMFDPEKKIGERQVSAVLDYARIPSLSEAKASVENENDLLTFTIDDIPEGPSRDWLMIESGMRQQAVCLACAALGVGMVFKNCGKNGGETDGGNYRGASDFPTVRMKLGPMKPSYDGSFWSARSPDKMARGILPEPARDGEKPMVSILKNVKYENREGRDCTRESLSQLLWAARGRTPHYYKSKPYGMTIPTWGGLQDITSVYVVSGGNLLEYVNREHTRATHSLSLKERLNRKSAGELEELFPSFDCLIVLGRNEQFARALWEAGYQLLNMTVQALSMDISYKVVFPDAGTTEAFKGVGVENPAAAFLLKWNRGEKHFFGSGQTIK